MAPWRQQHIRVLFCNIPWLDIPYLSTCNMYLFDLLPARLIYLHNTHLITSQVVSCEKDLER
eukprot:scaffold108306_cov69-Cyclotella_meneghiniana.AAC.1